MTVRGGPTILDVARVAGVSKGAVSLAFNDQPGLSEATRERILEAARMLSWRPRPTARGMRHRRAFAVGLVVDRPSDLLARDPFFPLFLAGIQSALAGADSVLVLDISDRHGAEQRYRALAYDRRVDGFLLIDPVVDDPRPALLAELGLPAVLAGVPVTDVGDFLAPDQRPGLPLVLDDDEPAVTELVGFLVESGHSSVAHVGGPVHVLAARSRERAWNRALTGHGIRAPDAVHGDFSVLGGAAATEQLLAVDPSPTAIVYANDLMALGGITTARRRGLRVPSDLSVVGFDDIELGRQLDPALTTVTNLPMQLGAQATEALLELIGGGPAADRYLPNPVAVLRDSAGPPPVPHRNRSIQT
jgi:DNA-binding LacI/PurR family transcriptional regulator